MSFVLFSLTGPHVKAAQAGCSYSVVPSSVEVGPDGGDGVVAVAVTTSNPGCSWTATSNAAWAILETPAYGYAAQVIADGAVGYWRLGESSGSNAADRSGHGFDGTVVGGVSWQADGALADGDKAATFDGSTGFVYVSPTALLDITTELTLETWVKSTDTGSWQRLVGKGTNGSEWDLWIHPSGWAHVQLGNTTGIREVTGTTVITDGQWHHVVATWDGTTTKLYVDGVLDASDSLTGTLVSNPYSSLEIGRDPARGFYTSGGLDEVAVYDQALTEDQVARHYALRTIPNAGGSGVVRYTISPNGPNSPPRSATLTVAGTSVAVFQDGLMCAYTATPASVSTDVNGGVAVVGISTNNPGCSWTASSNAAWVTLDEPVYGYPGRVLADGAVGYWRLGESNGTVAADRTGHGFSGSVVGELGWQRAGALADGDRAAYFNGTDSYITVSPTPSLDLTTALSLETWVQTAATGEWQRLLGKGTNGSQWDLWVAGNGMPVLQLGGSSGPSWLVGATSVADGQWHHLVAAWDGSTARLYVDSALVESEAFTGPLVPDPADGVVIGRDPQGYFTDGTLDEVAIYNHALSGADVADHFALRLVTAATTGSGAVVITVQPNPLGDPPRNASLTIAGLTVNVFEDSLTCSWAVAPHSITTGAAGASGVITVTPVHPSCTWSASSDAEWVALGPIVFSGTSGGGAVPYTIAPNLSSARSATVTVAGRAIRVAQSTEADEGRMTGAGRFGIPAGRLHFVFSAREREPQGERGRVSLWIPTWGSGWRPDRFTSSTVTSVTFSDDQAFQPGRGPLPTVDTVVFTGMGEWNGAPDYRYEIRAADRGEPGRGRDMFEVTIWNPGGVTVLRHYSDVLDGGNIQSYRLPGRVPPPPDTMPPDLSLPRGIVKEATSPAGAIVTYDVSARDRVSGRADVACDVASGITFPLGATVVHCFAADDAGNLANDSFSVTVRDTGAPVLTVPSNMAVNATTAAGALVTFAASATDIVDTLVTVVCAPASGSRFLVGTTTVNCTATDNAGNRDTERFTVTVNARILSVSTASLSFSGVRWTTCSGEQTGSNPGSKTVTVSNTGNTSLIFSAAATGGSWLSVSPSSGSIAAGDSRTLTVSAVSSALAAGTRNGSIVLTAAGALNAPATIPVALAVTPAPAKLCVAPTAMDLGKINYKATSAPQALTITNVGDAALAGPWTALRSNTRDTINISASTGTAPSTVTVSVKGTTQQDSKWHDRAGTITISSPGIAAKVVTLTWQGK